MIAGDETGQVQRSRVFATWFVWGSVSGTILLLIGTLVFWRLPHWAPEWVARYSPSLDYALRATRQGNPGEAQRILTRRAWEWEGGMAAFLRERWEHGQLDRHDFLERDLLQEMCGAANVEYDAQQRLPPSRAEEVMKRFRERSRDDLLAACLVQLTQPEAEQRGAAAENLAILGDPRAVPVLIQRLDDLQVEVGEKAAQALGAIGDPSAIPALIQHARKYPQRDPKPYLNPVAWIKDPIDEEHLIAMLAVPSDWARERAMIRLRLHRTSASLLAVVRLTVDASPGTATRARNLLQATLTSDEIPLLASYLQQDDAVLKAGSVVALADAGDEAAVAPLFELLFAGEAIDLQVEQALLGSLPAHNDQPLDEALLHPSPLVRAWVARELGRRRLAGSAGKLMLQSADVDPRVRAAVLRALGAMQVNEVLPLCERGLQSGHQVERVAAMRALGDLGDPAAITWVRPFLGSSQIHERQASAQVLGQVGQRGAVGLCQELRRLLTDPESSVQEAARTALERLSDDPDEVRALEQRRLDDFSLLPEGAKPPAD
jgi:HEAT repeat protein